jgi:hypothetical protein
MAQPTDTKALFVQYERIFATGTTIGLAGLGAKPRCIVRAGEE